MTTAAASERVGQAAPPDAGPESRPRVPAPRRRPGAILRALNPFAVLFGPTFQREVRTAGRKRGTYIARFAYTAGLLLVAAIAFMSFRQTGQWNSPVQRLQALQEFAPVITITVVWFQFVALTLAAPLLAAPAICDERRGRTLSALLTTPLTAGEIVGGKLTSRILQLVILALLSTPLLLAVRVFGGLDTRVVLQSAAITISVAVLGASLAVLYSVWHRRAASAALFAIFTLVLVQVGPPLVTVLVVTNADIGMNVSNRGQAAIAASMTACSPLVLGGVTAGGMGVAVPVAAWRSFWLFNVGYNLLLALAFGLVASVALRRVMASEATGEVAAASAAGPSEPEAAGEAGPVVERRRRERFVSDRPVLWREVRQATFSSPLLRYASAVLAVAGLGFLYWLAGFEEPGLHGSLAVLGVAAALVTSVFLTVGGITGEREARTWDVLLTTPLTAREILLGKFLGALRKQWFIPAVVLAHFVLAAAMRYERWSFIPKFLLIVSGPVLLLSATGLLFSLLFRKGVTAAVCNLALGLVLWVGSWLMVLLVLMILDLDRFGLFTFDGDILLEACYYMSPIAMIVTAVDGDALAGYASSQAPLYGIGDWRRLTADRFFAAITISWLAHAVLAAATLWLAGVLFPRKGGRTYPAASASAPSPARSIALAIAMLTAALLGGAVGFSVWGPLGAVGGLAAVLASFALMAFQDHRAARASVSRRSPTP